MNVNAQNIVLSEHYILVNTINEIIILEELRDISHFTNHIC